MDVRFINSKNEIINGSKLSIKAMGKYLVGMTAEAKIVEIEEYKEEGDAKEVLREVADIISGKRGEILSERGIIIDLRGSEEDGEI